MVFIRKAALLALWSALCMAIPSLAVVSPVVKPAIVNSPSKQDAKPTPTTAMRYDDGRKVVGAECDMPAGVLVKQQAQASVQPCRSRPVGWWQRGPVRRWISGGGPLRRWFGGRRGC